jgi:hypothetical protein
MEPSSSDRQILSKTRSNSSRKPSRTASSKYGSITEERNKDSNTNDGEEDNSSHEFQDTETGGGETFEIQEEGREEQDPNTRPTDHMSLNSLDHELTLKDKQEVLNA